MKYSACPARTSTPVSVHARAASTFVLPGDTPGAGKLADGQSFPLFQVVKSRVVYAATGNAGRELYASNGTENGSYLVRDIHPGPKSSGIRQLYGFHSNAVFNADDGTGRRQWVTDGTRQGTHPS